MVEIQRTFSDQPEPVSELINYLYSGKGRDLLDTVKLAGLLCQKNERKRKIRDLAEYIHYMVQCR